MPRWKQVLNCTNPDCRRRRWREVETGWADPAPDLSRLLRRAHCSECGCRQVEGRQYDIGPRVDDQVKPGGMRAGLVGFSGCENRDRERRESLIEYRLRHGRDFVCSRDPEYCWPPLPPLAPGEG